MTTEQNKSPPLILPFRVSTFEINADGDNRVIMGADNFSIAHLMDRLPEENAEIADFIVLACNSHHELLEAAEQADCPCTVKERYSGHKTECWMPALTAAIAKARGQQ